MQESKKLTWAELDDRMKDVINALDGALESIEESDEEFGWPEDPYGTRTPANEFRRLKDGVDGFLQEFAGREGKEDDWQRCGAQELQFALDIYPHVVGDMNLEFSTALKSAVDRWQIEYPECNTVGELMTSSSLAGRA